MTNAAKRTVAGFVVFLLLVLAGWWMSSWREESLLHAKEATLKTDLFRMRDALDEYTSDTGTCPDSLEKLNGRHLREIPVDPFTRSAESWQFVVIRMESGPVCDVKSGSPLVA